MAGSIQGMGVVGVAGKAGLDMRNAIVVEVVVVRERDFRITGALVSIAHFAGPETIPVWFTAISDPIIAMEQFWSVLQVKCWHHLSSAQIAWQATAVGALTVFAVL
mmetsp:Transcript_8053/g.18007  ORF Transcript_8053/g.18007 Transcript_8053/m.18007 type:complete len:106 (+) Transcript_8053:521-838(+)